jgi:hypothetical protein
MSNRSFDENPFAIRRLLQVCDERVARELAKPRPDIGCAVRVGALSLLLETIPLLGTDVAIVIGRKFLDDNRHASEEAVLALDEGVLRHFAEIIELNRYDWDSFSVSFVDPDAAWIDRLRRNLELTPAERLRRHGNLRAQMSSLRHAKSRN